MKKFLKITGIVLLLLIVLIVCLPFMFKGKLIELAKDQANNNLNAQVDFGAFDLSIFSTFPNFLFEISDVSVKNTGRFEGTTLAAIGKLELEVDLMSVIGGSNIEVTSIQITDPSFHVKVLADSSANYDIAKGGEGETETAEEASSDSDFQLGLQHLGITNANLAYEDATMDFSTEIEGLDLSLDGDFTASTTIVDLLMEIHSMNMSYEGVDYFKEASITSEIELDANLDDSRYECKDCALDLNELGLDFGGWFQMNEDDSYGMDLQFGARQTEFRNILSMVPAVYTRDFASVKTKGKLALEGMAKGKYTETELPAFAIDLVVSDASLQYPDLPKSVQNIQVDLHVNNKGGSEDNTVIDLKKFHAEMAGNPIDARLSVSTPVSDANIDAWVKGRIDLATVKDVVPLEEGEELNGIIESDITMKGRMSTLEQEKYDEFDCQGTLAIEQMKYNSPDLGYEVDINAMLMAFSPQQVALESFDSKIGKSDIKATGKIENFIAYEFGGDEVIKGAFDVTSSVLDVNEMMGPEEEVAEGSGEGASEEEEEPLEVIEIPGNIDFTMQSTLGKVYYDDWVIENIKGELIARNETLTFNDAKMDWLGGTATIESGYYETSNPEEPTVDFVMHVKNFDVTQTAETFNTVEKLAPMIKYCKGKFSTDVEFKGKLDNELMPKMESITADGGMLTHNLIVKGFKPLDKMAEALKKNEYSRMIIGNSNLTYEVKDGRVFVEPFNVKVGSLPAKLEGSNGFDQSIDYIMNMEIPRSQFGGAANSVLDDLTNKAKSAGVDVNLGDKIPVRVNMRGTVMEPKITTNLKDVADNTKEEIKDKIKDKVDEEVDKAKDKGKEELEKQIQQMLAESKKQADEVRKQGKVAAKNAKDEGYKQAQAMEDNAKNPIAKKAAKVGADKVRKESDKKAADIEKKANEKADKIEADAQKKADEMRKKADDV